MGSRHQFSAFSELNDHDRGGEIVTVTVAGSIITLLTILLRLHSSVKLKNLRDYDLPLLVAWILLLTQSVLTVHASNLGLGRHQDVLDGSQIEQIRKLQYAILAISTAVFTGTKVCVCLFVQAINAFGFVNRASWCLQGLTALFFLSATLAHCLQCPLPQPWLILSVETCVTAEPIYRFMLVANILTDSLITILAIIMALKVQTRAKTKAIIIALFSTRFLCPMTIVPALLDPSQIYNGDGTDFTWEGTNAILWLTITSQLSVITACVPTLKPFFDGMLGATWSVQIDGPYHLERVDGKAGFDITRQDEQHTGISLPSQRSTICQSLVPKRAREATQEASPHTTDSSEPLSYPRVFNTAFRFGKTSTTVTSPKSRTKTATELHQKTDMDCDMKRGMGRSDSVKGLTDGVIMVFDEVDVQYDASSDSRSYSSKYT